MNYITDYQLDINKGFMCKVNGKTFKCEFLISNSTGKHFYISNILHVADAMGIPRHEFIGIFNSDHVNHVIYCDSKQECYDLCQHIVKTYFRPKQTEHERLVPDIHFTYNDKHYQFTLKTLNGKYVWQNVNDICTHIFIKTHPDLPKIKKELNINISTSPHSEYLGFDTIIDAGNFIRYIIDQYYSQSNKKETYENQLRKKELLSAEELNQQEVSYMVDEAKLQFDADVLNTKRALATKKAELEEAKTSYPLDSQKIINLQIDVEAYQDGLRRLMELKKEFNF